MRFEKPDSWSPFGKGGLNAYGYCVGDPVNRSDTTGHVSFFKGVLNFLGLRTPSVVRTAATVSQRSPQVSFDNSFTTYAQGESRTQNSGDIGVAVTVSTLPVYSDNEAKPILPTYEQDKVISSNSKSYERNQSIINDLKNGGGPSYFRPNDREVAITILKKKQREIRSTNKKLMFEAAPKQPISAEEQARNRELLGRIINRKNK
jgi:hypothetical protein